MMSLPLKRSHDSGRDASAKAASPARRTSLVAGAAALAMALAVGYSPTGAHAQDLTFDDPTPTSGDAFGTSAAIDGANVLVGAPLDDTNEPDVGQTHLFSSAVVPVTITAGPSGTPNPVASGAWPVSR